MAGPTADSGEARVRRPPPRVWVVRSIGGVIAGAVFWAVSSFGIWVSAGGPFGDLSDSTRRDVDWGHYHGQLVQCWAIGVLIAGVVPLVWALSVRRHAADHRGRRQATWAAVGVVTVVLVPAAAPGVGLLLDRSRATEPDARVVAALEEAAGRSVERQVTKVAEDGPWVVTYRASSTVRPSDVVRALPDAGEWLCPEHPNGGPYFYRSELGWTVVAPQEDAVTVEIAREVLSEHHRAAHCP